MNAETAAESEDGVSVSIVGSEGRKHIPRHDAQQASESREHYVDSLSEPGSNDVANASCTFAALHQ